MSDDIKARLTLALKCPGCIPQGTANLLQSCLKHIEELEGEMKRTSAYKVVIDDALDRLQAITHWHSVFKQKSEELSASLEAREELICSLTKEKWGLLERLQAVETALELTRNWIRFNGHTGQHAHEGCKPCELQSLAEKALQKDAQPPKQ